MMQKLLSPTLNWNWEKWLPWLFAALATTAGVGSGLLIPRIDNPALVFVIVAGMPALFISTTRPETGLVFLVFMTYTRLSDVLKHYHGLPSIFQPFIGYLILIILLRWYLYGEEVQRFKRTVLFIGAYGLVGFSSLLYAVDHDAAMHMFEDFVKSAVVALVIVLMLQRTTHLRLVIWALVAAGILMGSISCYQYITGTYDNIYWGFGQAAVQNIIGKQDDYRLAGPVGDPNFYSQFMVVIVPLALDRVWTETRPLLRLLAGWSLGVTVLTIVFTFSRGALIALIVVMVLMMVRRPPNLGAIVITIALAIPLMQFVPDSYLDRLTTLLDLVPGLGSDDAAVTEVSYRGRTSEMLIGLYMFRDNPFIGVGFENYPTHYQKYSRQLGMDPRLEDRHAHSLYIQILAEHGLMGAFSFGGILLVAMYYIYKAERKFKELGYDEEEGIAAAFFVAMVGYLIAAVFLHMAYPRYFWLLIGIAYSLPNVVKFEQEFRKKEEKKRLTAAANLTQPS